MTAPQAAPAGWFARWCMRQWQQPSAAAILLRPLAGLFHLLGGLRRALYRTGLRPVEHLPVPVIVIGNITVGGTGKTPLVLWLVQYLKRHGWHPAILSRGYGSAGQGARAVTADSRPEAAGDEPVLLAQHAGCPVWVGRRRAEAARACLAAHPEVNVLVCDDGLQHYALARDVEVVVIDAGRGFGNGRLLPAGPLREPVARLRQVDAVVINGSTASGPQGLAMQLQGDTFYQLNQPERQASAADFQHLEVHALAGIGHPQRFFDQLSGMGLAVTGHAFPDHHAYTYEDIAAIQADIILMTEKDAVKCRQFKDSRCWVLPVQATVDGALGELVIRKLRTSHGSQIT